MTTLTLTYHQDPGHGWIEVPAFLLREFGVTQRISGYSYRREDTAYLEEDCDAAVFIEAAKERGISVTLRELHTDNDSFIRQLSRFAPL